MNQEHNQHSATRHLRKLYIMALSVIAVLSILGQILIQYELSLQSKDSHVVNIAGRQRMLSQKLSKTILVLRSVTDPAARKESIAELEGIVTLWEQSHLALKYGNAELDILPTEAPSVIHLFNQIEPHYQKILKAANALLEIATQNENEFDPLPQTKTDPLIKTILAEDPNFLKKMDEIVFEYDRLAVEQVYTLGRTQLILLGMILIVLLVVALFVFRPAELQIHQTISALEQSKLQVEQREAEGKKQEWLSTRQAELSDTMRGQQDESTLAKNVIKYLCKYLQAQVGAIYIKQNDNLQLLGSYAYPKRKNFSNHFEVGESLVGQAALEKETILLTNIPADYIKVTSGLGETSPQNILVSPFSYEDEVTGVVELASLAEFGAGQIEFLEKVMPNIAITFNMAWSRTRMNELLDESQQQAEELQVQEEELRAANVELEAQAKSLERSQERLKTQQEELQATNAELEDKTQALSKQQVALEKRNKELLLAHAQLEQKAREVTLASKYKSEFLANMSHELRTPLNSILILARMLADNDVGNLSGEQTESARVIFKSGNDLLNLINDILDLSKVEAGKMELNLTRGSLTSLKNTLQQQFAHVAEEKGLEFEVILNDALPETILTDWQRVEQILKNLISNAIKFTGRGSVTVTIYRSQQTDELHSDLDLSGPTPDPAQTVAFSITDTGIGISTEQQDLIFEAFQQVDSSLSRQYTGTGLGLSISKSMATFLHGKIRLQSTPGQGSTFTLYLPETLAATMDTAGSSQAVAPGEQETEEKKDKVSPSPQLPLTNIQSSAPTIPDDRDNLSADDNILLIIEDDLSFAKILYNIARKNGFKCLTASDGETGLNLARTCKPDAIILDLQLPDISGWGVLNGLKNNPDLRHIPVHIMSAEDENLAAFRQGAMGFLTKPVSREALEGAFQKIDRFVAGGINLLLLVEDDADLRQTIYNLLSRKNIEIIETETGKAALNLLRSQPIDCMILDLKLPDISGFEILDRLSQDDTMSRCPIVIYTGQELTREENQTLMKYADSVILKSAVSSERLLDETALFLHQVVADLPEEKQQAIKRLYSKDAMLADKRILIVDDDMRNSFALSKLLTDKGVVVEIAGNGEKALELLAAEPDFDLVLMDIMMPVMDGLETTRKIRAQKKFKQLPILALTAKAMKGDREKCLAAGANDYLTKPVDTERLLTMLRVWFYR